MSASTVSEQTKRIIKSAFRADALSLSYHWVYDADQLSKIDASALVALEAPHSKWHVDVGATRGDLTQYGNTSKVLLESVVAEGSFSRADFLKRLVAYWSSAALKSYVDGATKDVLNSREPSSNDFSAVGRNFALLAVVAGDDEEQLAGAARAQAGATHSALVSDAAEYFARVTSRVLSGNVDVVDALRDVAKRESVSAEIRDGVERGLAAAAASDASNDLDTIGKFGRSCSIGGALPSTVYLIAKCARQEDSVGNAVRASIAAGGDSSARALVAATVLAAASSSSNSLIDNVALEYTVEAKVDSLLA
jgi:ADP-ribosylglycohydrolase